MLVRISDDREGEEKGVKRQQLDCRRHADHLHWAIGETIIENDTSAFKRRKVQLPDGSHALRVVRPGFRRALEMLASGEADGLIAYDLDRACRDPRDLEDLIDVVEQRRLPVTSVSGSLRLANDADITMARVMVAVANKASRDTSRRVSRKHEELAEAGKPGGGGIRAYGYEQNGMTVREEEAAVIREMVARVLSSCTEECPAGCREHGWSLSQLVADLNSRGVKPSRAAAWNSRSVSSILRGPRIAGLRQFRGEIAGEAVWPAIIERDVWNELQILLSSRTGPAKRPFVRWLTRVLKCGLCGFDLAGWQGTGGVRYWCATPNGGCGRIAINAGHAEAEVERQILKYLDQPKVLTGLRGAYSSDALSIARTDLASDEQQLKELVGLWARRELSFVEYNEARRIINERIKSSRALVGSSLPAVVRALLAGDVRVGWGVLTPAQRRDVVLAIVPGYRVMPASPGLRVFDSDRLQPIE